MARHEWDEYKRRENLKKHGIDFADVPTLFERPYIEDFDAPHSTTEDRWRALGMVGDKTVVCVYTMRGQIRRLISARRASRAESMIYLQRFWFDPKE